MNRLMAPALLAVAVTAAAAIVGGVAAGPIYAAIFVLATLPGLPIGLLLFGRRQPAGWIAGALIG